MHCALGNAFSQIASSLGWTFRASYGMQRLMAPPVIAIIACLLFACPHAAAWMLPAYAGLLAWNGRSWLALAVGLLFLAFYGLSGGKAPKTKTNLASNRTTDHHRTTKKSPTGTSLRNGLRSAWRSFRRFADVMNSRSRARVMPT